jgi:hypothetical protein
MYVGLEKFKINNWYIPSLLLVLVVRILFSDFGEHLKIVPYSVIRIL